MKYATDGSSRGGSRDYLVARWVYPTKHVSAARPSRPADQPPKRLVTDRQAYVNAASCIACPEGASHWQWVPDSSQALPAEVRHPSVTTPITAAPSHQPVVRDLSVTSLVTIVSADWLLSRRWHLRSHPPATRLRCRINL